MPGTTVARMSALVVFAAMGIAVWWAHTGQAPADQRPAVHDAEIVGARTRAIAAGASTLRDGDALSFEYQRDLIEPLGYMRASDARSVDALLGVLCVNDPSYVRSPITFRIELMWAVTPTPWALARVGLPAVPSLLDTIGREDATDDQVEKAEEALEQMLGREATYWLAARADAGSTGRENLQSALARARGHTPMPANDDTMMWGMFGRATPEGDIPAEPPADLATGLASPDAGIRYVSINQLRSQRYRDTRALAAKVADADLPAEDRARAATTLGLIRAVSYDAGEGPALLSLLAEERLALDTPVTDLDAPAAMALVRIGVPMVPMLCRTIRESDDAQLRSNCAGVVATMLGRYGRPWLEGVRDAAEDQKQRRQVAAELKTWSSRFEGEGYWAG